MTTGKDEDFKRMKIKLNCAIFRQGKKSTKVFRRLATQRKS